MGISSDFSVHRHQRAVIEPGRRSNDLIGRVTMEYARQLGRLNSDLRCQVQQPYPWIKKSLGQPRANGKRQNDLAAFHKFCDLPTGDNTHSKTFRLMLSDKTEVMRRQLSIAMNPPNPNMGVKNDQLNASQSCSATGSVGLG